MITRILFVCTGNICRSPTAHGVLVKRLADLGMSPSVDVDSAGMIGYHAGEKPDYRAIQVAAKYDVDLSALRARRIDSRDYENYDHLFAMDRGHLRLMQEQCPAGEQHRLQLFLEQGDVPDPYYGSMSDFEAMYQLIADRIEYLIADLKPPSR